MGLLYWYCVRWVCCLGFAGCFLLFVEVGCCILCCWSLLLQICEIELDVFVLGFVMVVIIGWFYA